MALEAKNITLLRGAKAIIRDLSITIDPGEITVIIGPNGCGKSTLLHGLAGLLPACKGEVLWRDAPLARIPRRRLAREVTLLQQHPQAPEGQTLRQVVTHGRFPHLGHFARMTASDQAIVEDALERTRTLDLAERPFAQLSGGERQRGWIALALAQAPRLMLLDEPTSYLDLGHQLQLLKLLQQLSLEGALGLVIVLHDVNQATMIADRIIALEKGEIVADGPPRKVITSALIARLFEAQVEILSGRAGRPYCVPADALSGRI